MKTILDVEYGSVKSELNRLDLYLPEKQAQKMFLYFHGGGLTGGVKVDPAVRKVAQYLTSKGIAFASANYRLYPDAKYPDFIYDCAEATASIKAYMEQNGIQELYIGGSSAGGYLSMMLCFDKKYLESVGLSNRDISGYFHDAGQPTAHFSVLEYSGRDSRRVIVDESCPLYYVGCEASYPRMRFIVSDNDIKNRYEQTMLMLSTLKHFGYGDFDHIVMHGTHCHYCSSYDENGDCILGKMIYEFMESV